MLQTNYNLPIDLEIVCENETLKKVVGTAGVESARRTREQWNYMPVLCYMRFSPYSIRVKLNRFADPNKKYSCIFYIDDKAIRPSELVSMSYDVIMDMLDLKR